MNIDIVEGATDKSDSGLRAILSAQAKLRIFIAVPVVIVEALLYLMSPDGVAGRLVRDDRLLCLCRHHPRAGALPALRAAAAAVLATAVLDPLALSAWLVVMGEYGSIMVGFYLYAILASVSAPAAPLMRLCQLTAVASFLLVFLSVPYWQQHPTI